MVAPRPPQLRILLACALLLGAAGLAGGTEDDGRSVIRARFWLDAAARLQAEGNSADALRCAVACVRVDAESFPCRTQAGSILAFGFGREPEALLHFVRTAEAHPGLRTLTNLGLAFSRLYLNDLSGDAYAAALAHDGAGAAAEDWGDALFRMAEARQVVCAHWDSLEDRARMVGEAAGRLAGKGLRTLTPFLAMSLPLPAELILQITASHARAAVRDAAAERGEAEAAMRQRLPLPVPAGGARPPLVLGGGRVRVAYLAAHFSRPWLMNGFLQGVWGLHDRERLEVFCFAWSGHHEKDVGEEKTWIASQVENFISADRRTDRGYLLLACNLTR